MIHLFFKGAVEGETASSVTSDAGRIKPLSITGNWLAEMCSWWRYKEPNLEEANLAVS